MGSYLGLLGGILHVIASKSLAVGKLSASIAGLAPWEGGPRCGGGGGVEGEKPRNPVSGPAEETGLLHGLPTSTAMPKVP